MCPTNELDKTFGLSDEKPTERFKELIRIDNGICVIRGLSISKYDDELGLFYLEYPEGKRVYD